ncbi:hypothetical protein [Myxococcus xanthus]|nr:hypothetical protein [Myxococcus xanthus]NOJ85826.1 hypothetical protein [Myxococcus xanthus]
MLQVLQHIAMERLHDEGAPSRRYVHAPPQRSASLAQPERRPGASMATIT